MWTKCEHFLFLNLPLWANFYNYPDLSGASTTLEQPTLLDDLNLSLNPQPVSQAAKVEASWDLTQPANPNFDEILGI